MAPLHPQAETFLAAVAARPPVRTLADDAAIAQRREDTRRAAATEPREDVADVRDLDTGGVTSRLVRPAGSDPAGRLPVLVYLHGGGFVMGDRETHDATARRLANAFGRATLLVDYRRPPEHRFPAALEDSVAAVDWLQHHGADEGLDPDDLLLVGDSAGANLAVGVARHRPGRAGAAVLVYPFLDPGTAGSSYASTRGGLDREDARWYWQRYLPEGTDLDAVRDPDVNPLLATDLAALPPTLVQVAGEDTLADEDRELVRLAREQGVDVTTTEHPGMPHGFWREPRVVDAADEALREAVAWHEQLTRSRRAGLDGPD